MACALIAASIAFEIYLVKRFKRLLAFLEKGGMRTLIFSLGLSYILGWIFGAAGMVVMIAGLVSTVIMQPIYKVWRLMRHVKKVICRKPFFK